MSHCLHHVLSPQLLLSFSPSPCSVLGYGNSLPACLLVSTVVLQLFLAQGPMQLKCLSDYITSLHKILWEFIFYWPTTGTCKMIQVLDSTHYSDSTCDNSLPYSGHTRHAVAAAAARSLQSCPTLCDPLDSSPPGSAVPGILQARILEWIAISFSNAWKWKVKVKLLSCVWLFATPWTPGSSAHGIFQARVLEWGAIAMQTPLQTTINPLILCL